MSSTISLSWTVPVQLTLKCISLPIEIVQSQVWEGEGQVSVQQHDCSTWCSARHVSGQKSEQCKSSPQLCWYNIVLSYTTDRNFQHSVASIVDSFTASSVSLLTVITSYCILSALLLNTTGFLQEGCQSQPALHKCSWSSWHKEGNPGCQTHQWGNDTVQV